MTHEELKELCDESNYRKNIEDCHKKGLKILWRWRHDARIYGGHVEPFAKHPLMWNDMVYFLEQSK